MLLCHQRWEFFNENCFSRVLISKTTGPLCFIISEIDVVITYMNGYKSQCIISPTNSLILKFIASHVRDISLPHVAQKNL